MAEHFPAPGDVLITKRGPDGFEISVVPGQAQLLLRQKFEAVQQAHAFASRTGSTVWFIEAGSSYTKVDPPRPNADGRPPSHATRAAARDSASGSSPSVAKS